MTENLTRPRAALGADAGAASYGRQRDLQVYRGLKRGLDIIGALCGILLCLPLWIVIAILIKLDSRGPILFRQSRPGQDGVPFLILKFRTMAEDAEAQIHRVLPLNKERNHSLIRIDNDPRVTRVGQMLRTLSLDETPQFFNVLRGEMSLVGPRPISRYIPDPRGFLRLEARPGLTGLWQISGRKDTDCDFMLEKDMEYLQRRCLTLDLVILLGTLRALVQRNGAK
jgi:lipopolysaccharide/colanic/teichoic acid biosynthesis glycosyltransferase